MKKFLIILLLLIPQASEARSASPDVNALSDAILSEKFYPEKLEKGDQLGALKTPEAKEALYRLFSHSSYWNRHAAAKGLFHFRDPKTAALLVRAFVEDHMIDSFLAEGFLKDWDLYWPAIEALYPGQNPQRDSRKLLDFMDSARQPQSLAFLKSVVRDSNDPARVYAFRLLTRRDPLGNDDFLREFLDDPGLRASVLDHILAHGSSKDLSLFLSILNRDAPPYRSRAMTGVNQWADAKTKERIFYTCLQSRETQTLCQAMAAFDQVQSRRIMDRLCRLCETGSFQRLRMLAALQLAEYEDPDIIPCLKHFHQEDFIPDRKDGWDVFFTHITFGMTTAAEYLLERDREKAFYTAQERISRKLMQMGD